MSNASSAWGTTCSGVTQLRLWTPWRSSQRKTFASSAALSSSPAAFWLISQFWQKTQRRLQPAKKTVPEPRRPRSTSSSPKWGKALATRARRPMRQTPIRSARRSTAQPRGQTRQGLSSSSARSTRRASSPVASSSR